ADDRRERAGVHARRSRARAGRTREPGGGGRLLRIGARLRVARTVRAHPRGHRGTHRLPRDPARPDRQRRRAELPAVADEAGRRLRPPAMPARSRAAPFTRHAGILLHPSSLPGPHGAGDLGAAAHAFVDWLAAARQTLWQMLPLGGLGPGNSPYMSPSAFAGNELLIDLEALHEAGWLDAGEIAPAPSFDAGRVDYAAVRPWRMARLRRAAERFFAAPRGDAHERYTAFCDAARDWLDDYVLFMAIEAREGGRPWQEGPPALARREPAALREAVRSLAAECAFVRFCQWCFDTQWHALRARAAARG